MTNEELARELVYLNAKIRRTPQPPPSRRFRSRPALAPNVPVADYKGNPRAATIAEASRRLVDMRDRWLNPPEWVEWVDEPAPGYPPRPRSSR